MSSERLVQSRGARQGELVLKCRKLLDLLAAFREKSEKEVARVRDAWREECEKRDLRVRTLESTVAELKSQNKLLSDALAQATGVAGAAPADTSVARVYEESADGELADLRARVLQLSTALQLQQEPPAREEPVSSEAAQLRQLDKAVARWAAALATGWQIEFNVSSNGCLLRFALDRSSILDYATVHFEFDDFAQVFENRASSTLLAALRTCAPFTVEESEYHIALPRDGAVPACVVRLFGSNSELDQLVQVLRSDLLARPHLSNVLQHIASVDAATRERINCPYIN